MGWTESPPAFSAVTETIADLVNVSLERNLEMPKAHPMEAAASIPVPLSDPEANAEFPVQDTGPLPPPLAYVNIYVKIYVNDFIKLAQGWYNALCVHRHTYHTIDQVFCPNDDQDLVRKQPILQKKLLKGNDSWSTEKLILGWLINSVTKTISLPQHRKDRLDDLLAKVLRRK